MSGRLSPDCFVVHCTCAPASHVPALFCCRLVFDSVLLLHSCTNYPLLMPTSLFYVLYRSYHKARATEFDSVSDINDIYGYLLQCTLHHLGIGWQVTDAMRKCVGDHKAAEQTTLKLTYHEPYLRLFSTVLSYYRRLRWVQNMLAQPGNVPICTMQCCADCFSTPIRAPQRVATHSQMQSKTKPVRRTIK